MKKTYYTIDSVTADANAVPQMIELQKQGWKDLQYVGHNSWGDCQTPEIMGSRPMTPEEVKELEKTVKATRKANIRKLKQLAKELGFTVKKNP